MSKFNYCYKLVLKSDVSHAWIHLHRCVEAYARTTGETFSSIFDRIEKKFKFERQNPHRWPDLTEILKAADYLKSDRDDFLEELNRLIEERKNEKKKGMRISKNKGFNQINEKQKAYKHKKQDHLDGVKQDKTKLKPLSLIAGFGIISRLSDRLRAENFEKLRALTLRNLV